MEKQTGKAGASRSSRERRKRRRRRKRLIRYAVMAALVILLILCVFAIVWAVQFLLGMVSASGPGSQPAETNTASGLQHIQGIRVQTTESESFESSVSETESSVPETESSVPETESSALETANETGYTLESSLDKILDIKLAEILTPGGDVQRQVKDIYVWARTCLTYASFTDKSSLTRAAEEMLLTGAGDCYGYYAVTKVMFDKLGIPNISVQKQPADYDSSEHYWSLVSTDGGQTWYHFDATPRVGDGDDFCLVTDAFLDEYSKNHKESHRRDKSLYPATP